MDFSLILTFFNAFAFFYYGLNCIFSSKMTAEFYRYGLTDTQRKLTGILQVLGAVGVLIGLFNPAIGLIATAGLTTLMLLGFGVRLKIRDSIGQSFPSFAFMILNAYLFFYFLLL